MLVGRIVAKAVEGQYAVRRGRSVGSRCCFDREIGGLELGRFDGGSGEPFPIVEVALRDLPVPHRVTHVGMAEDAAGGDVGGTGPDRDRDSLVQEHDELVVPDTATRFLRLTKIADAGLGDHRLVDSLVRLRLVADLHVGAGRLRPGEGLADRCIVELVEHGAKLEVVTVRTRDEREQRLVEPAR